MTQDIIDEQKQYIKATAPEFWIIVLAILSSIQLWSCRVVPPRIYDFWGIIITLVLFFKAFQAKTGVLNVSSSNPYHIFAFGFLWIPVLSYISDYFVHDQSPLLSLLIQRTNYLWLLYFLIHRYALNPKVIFKLILIIAGAWAFLTIIQQFTFPSVYFFNKIDEEADTPFEYRAGLYRFMIRGAEYGVFGCLYLMNQFLETKKNKYFLFAVFLLVGIYCFATRQIMFSSLLAIGILWLKYFVSKGLKISVKAVVIIAAAVIGVAFMFDQIFGKFIELTLDDASNDNIRITSSKFFLFDFWDHWICYFFGNGIPHSWSAYGAKMLPIQTAGLWQNDVGLIGAFNTYGIFYVILSVWLYIKVVRTKLNFSVYYLKSFFHYCIINIMVASRFSVESSIPLFCLIFYLLDLQAKQPSPNTAILES